MTSDLRDEPLACGNRLPTTCDAKSSLTDPPQGQRSKEGHFCRDSRRSRLSALLRPVELSLGNADGSSIILGFTASSLVASPVSEHSAGKYDERVFS